MQNSHVSLVLGAFQGIILDAKEAFPECRQDLDRDLTRLLSLVENRGFSYLTLTLPDAGKHFDMCLSLGCLSDFNLPGFGKKLPESVVPKFLSALLLRVFDVSGVLCPTPDITAILFLRQLFYTAKKVRITCDESRTRKSVREFFRIESGMRTPNLDWFGSAILDTSGSRMLHLSDGVHTTYHQDREDPDSAGWATDLLFQLEHQGSSPPSRDLLDTVQRTADVVAGSLGHFDPLDERDGEPRWRTRHGPGAVADLKGHESKYSFPNWPAKLEGIFPCADFAFANYGQWADILGNKSVEGRFLSEHEPPSKLIAVPKTQKGPRLIASEPTAHQWAQQSLNKFLRVRTKETFLSRSIHFRDQAYNREGALRASKTGTHWTIDLSSASDCLSLWAVERAFRANSSILRALHSCRTRWIENTIDPDSPKYSFLRKVAPQGAAFTFPLQSIFYATVVYGCMLHALHLQPSIKSIGRMAREVLVFGDDIIAPSQIGELVVQVLTYLGFQVNDLKTYKTGKFRESCGLEAYDGVEVTPAYVLEAYDSSKPSTVASLVDCSNNFHRKGFWRTAEMLISTLPDKIRESLAVVPDGSGSFGLNSYCGQDLSHLRMRWNHDLQQYEVKVRAVVSTVRKLHDRGDARLLQYFTEDPDPNILWESGINARPVTVTRNRWVPVSSL
ncbi:MAG: putative replicase protein [Koroslivirus faecicola]|uniref:RNA-directed RNA polymerase n=1 Tax=Leviviridae sp. TaxID=2027243 RepID=A0ABY3SSG6_9VIRU|nr:MAG: putative replicase protein [Leviviridae sp.]